LRRKPSERALFKARWARFYHKSGLWLPLGFPPKAKGNYRVIINSGEKNVVGTINYVSIRLLDWKGRIFTIFPLDDYDVVLGQEL